MDLWKTLHCCFLVSLFAALSAHNVADSGTKRTVTSIDKASVFRIRIDEKKVRCKVDKRFVSFAMSAGLFNKSLADFDFGSRRLKTILKALSPAVIRVGGSRANFMYFEETEEMENPPGEPAERGRQPPPPITVNVKGDEDSHGKDPSSGMEKHLQEHMEQQSDIRPDQPPPDVNARKEEKKKKISGFKDYTISKDVFDDLYNLINGTGNSLLFDLNAFPRANNVAGADNKWDSWNAERLIRYVKEKNYNVLWQLGNEPNHYKQFSTPEVNRELTGSQVKADYNDLKRLLKRLDGRETKIIGPDVTRPKGMGDKVDQWLSDFLQAPGNSIDYLSWHQYYVDGREAKAEDFVDPRVLDQFVKQNRLMKIIKRKNSFNKPVWITETGSAWGGGAKDLSNRFAGVFPWVDKLGVAGENCIQVVARQALFSGKYQLIEKETFTPHPEYYTSVLFKRLASNKVLDVQLSGESRRFRVYARCAKTYRGTLPGSVVFTVINLYNQEKTFGVIDYELFDLQQYLFTANNLQSDVVKLNGLAMGIDAGDTLPPMRPKVVKQPVKIPPRSVGYYVLDKVNLQIC